jgi:hypothetical protein
MHSDRLGPWLAISLASCAPSPLQLFPPQFLGSSSSAIAALLSDAGAPMAIYAFDLTAGAGELPIPRHTEGEIHMLLYRSTLAELELTAGLIEPAQNGMPIRMPDNAYLSSVSDGQPSAWRPAFAEPSGGLRDVFLPTRTPTASPCVPPQIMNRFSIPVRGTRVRFAVQIAPSLFIDTDQDELLMIEPTKATIVESADRIAMLSQAAGPANSVYAADARGRLGQGTVDQYVLHMDWSDQAPGPVVAMTQNALTSAVLTSSGGLWIKGSGSAMGWINAYRFPSTATSADGSVQIHTGDVLAVRTSTYVVRYTDTTAVESPAVRKGRLVRVAEGWVAAQIGLGGLVTSDRGELFQPGAQGWELFGTFGSTAAADAFDVSGPWLVFGASDGTLHSIIGGVQCPGVPLFPTPVAGIAEAPEHVLVTIGAPSAGLIPVVALRYPQPQ